MPTTLTGEVERVTYENEATSFRVIRLGSLEGAGARRGSVPVVGTFAAVGPGTRVRVTGDFVVDPKRGEQFRVETLVPIAPSTLAGLEKYLGSGVIPGVGPGFAKRIVSTFGLESLSVLDEHPERLGEVSGIGARRIEEIKKTWASQRAISNIMMLLQAHGASPALAVRIFKQYGEKAASVLQRSPYRLALDVRGVGFKTADRIARSLGISGDHPERAQAGVMHELGVFAEQGHVVVPRELIAERAAAMLEIDESHVTAAIESLWASERVVVEDGGVYLKWLYQAEVAVASGLRRLLDSPGRELGGLDAALADFERASKIELAPGQRAAVEAAARHKVVVITGGPGVGKTTIVRAILNVLGKSRLRVKLAAPTGRAAKRLSESTGLEASTLHRLLAFDPRQNEFQLDAENPIEADVAIVDEASMIDVPLGAALIGALPTASRLIVVGDADQLPSVGPGALLRDLIESNAIPTVRLNEIFRQAGESRIVTNAHRILHGEMPESADPEAPNADFFVVPRRTPEEAAELVRELVVTRIPRRFALDPKRDVQVLTPMHRGAAGTIALNELLQSALNPEGPALESRGQKLRLGDKVMQTRNDYEREAFNGDIGVVSAVDLENRKLSVRFEQRDVEYDDVSLDALTLAYATSIHKSQGSEYPAVVIPLLTAHFVMLSRNLVYTAVTRAKKLCVLAADPRAIRLALAETRRDERMTRLAARLQKS
ncbi:MAG TPA: ATP-dependent RecD-like DNA helicase [Polyangiaceae bacterium]|nr:ATP-dependent RecD-like DNA helicase [Polyangiaceae bacterium]